MQGGGEHLIESFTILFLFLDKLKLFKANVCANFWTLQGVKFQLIQIRDHLCVLSLTGHEGEGGSEEDVSVPSREGSKKDGPQETWQEMWKRKRSQRSQVMWKKPYFVKVL